MGVLHLWNSIQLILTFLWHSTGGAAHLLRATVYPLLQLDQDYQGQFLCFLENVLWKMGEIPQFSFLVVGVLPGTLLKVLSRPTVPVQDPPLVLPDIGLKDEEQGSPSQECSLEVLPVLAASLDVTPSLVLGVASPSCFLTPAKLLHLDIAELGPNYIELSLSSHGMLQTISLFFQRFQTVLCLLLLLLWRNGIVLSPVPVVLQTLSWVLSLIPLDPVVLLTSLTVYQTILMVYQRISIFLWRNHVWMWKSLWGLK